MHDTLTPAQQAVLEYVGFMGRVLQAHGMRDETNDYLLIQKQGQLWMPQVLPAKYQYGQLRQCFANAYRLAKKSHGKLRYCEGIANAIIPTPHAWTVTEDGKVVDPTWRTRPGDEHGHNPDDLAYYGVAFDMEFVTVNLLKNGHYGLLLGNKLF